MTAAVLVHTVFYAVVQSAVCTGTDHVFQHIAFFFGQSFPAEQMQGKRAFLPFKIADTEFFRFGQDIGVIQTVTEFFPKNISVGQRTQSRSLVGEMLVFMGSQIDIHIFISEMIAEAVVFVLDEPAFDIPVILIYFRLMGSIEQLSVHFKIADGKFEIGILISVSEMLTGETAPENITGDDVMNLLIEKVKTNSNGIQYNYYDSELVKAIKYGWLCENTRTGNN